MFAPQNLFSIMKMLLVFLCFFLSTASSALNDTSDRNQRDPGCVTRPHPPPLAVMFYDKVTRPLIMTILLLACPALSPPPDHHQLSGQVKPFLAPGKTNYSARPGSCIKVGDLHPYRLPDHADDPCSQFSDHDVKDLLQLDNLLDKDILMSPIIPNPCTLLSSPRPPDPHL